MVRFKKYIWSNYHVYMLTLDHVYMENFINSMYTWSPFFFYVIDNFITELATVIQATMRQATMRQATMRQAMMKNRKRKQNIHFWILFQLTWGRTSPSIKDVPRQTQWKKFHFRWFRFRRRHKIYSILIYPHKDLGAANQSEIQNKWHLIYKFFIVIIRQHRREFSTNEIFHHWTMRHCKTIYRKI